MFHDGVQIDREVHIAASVAQVSAHAHQCPCPAALTFVPEGAGTRARVRAEVTPDDLARHVEQQLVDLLRSIRTHFEQPNQTTNS